MADLETQIVALEAKILAGGAAVGNLEGDVPPQDGLCYLDERGCVQVFPPLVAWLRAP